MLFMSVLAFCIPVQAQYSRTKNAKDIDNLELENENLKFEIENLKGQFDKMSVSVDSLERQGDNQKVIIPTDEKEAQTLLVYVLGILQFIFVGAIAKRLPPWLTPFTLSLIIGALIVILAFTFSKGEFTIAEALVFYAGILGIGNGIHQVKKVKGSASIVAAT